MRPTNRWPGVLVAAVCISACRGDVSTNEERCKCTFFADGVCDKFHNNAECGYDGGDCCSCTCVDGGEFKCGDYGFACIDPSAECVDDDGITAILVENCGFPGAIGNGICDNDNNKEECGYDGGDCCSCTCQVPAEFMEEKFRCSKFIDYACVDPEASCVDDDDITVNMLENCEYISSLGDGWCDLRNNNAECGYDGGDCCECTCEPRLL
ncbi:unnamed protein product, partial [Ectocarpus fasciculatus]